VAVLATYRRDGTVLLSPVWHEWRDAGFGVVTGSGDVKARHLRAGPRCDVRLVTDGVDEAVRRIATRYLGSVEGPAYADRGMDDLLLRLEPGTLRAWDFADEYGG
jgi:Pyridoxamine 5'-phosphate oxidase